MRGSLSHDVFFQLMRMGIVPQSEKDIIDRYLQLDCLEDGMEPLRSDWVYWGVKRFGKFAAKVQPPPKIYTAPRK